MFKKLFNNKKGLYIAIFSILGVFLIISGVYALVTWQSNDYHVAIKSTCMDIYYSKGQDIDTNLNIIDEDDFINRNTNTITISPDMVFSNINIGLSSQCTDINGFATIEINVTSLSQRLRVDYFNSLRYVLVEYDPNNYPNLNMSELSGKSFTILSSGSIINTGTTDIYYKYLSPGDNFNYLIFFYADNELIGNNAVELEFNGSVSARAEQYIATPINDFTYTISGNNITLTKYNGNDSVIELPPTYIVDGTEYNTVIASKLFIDNIYIEEVYFSDGITASNGDAIRLFYGCSKLKEVVNLPINITNLYYAFGECTSLVNAPEIPNSVRSMASAFYGCTSLVNAPVIPNSVADLSYTFQGCTNLVNAPVIPNSVTNMDYTFVGCSSVVNAPVIPNSVTSMSGTFAGTALVTSPVIPNSVTNISGIFRICTNLVNAPVIPDSVTNMARAFYGCTSLVNAPLIPNSVTDMSETFSRCTSLVTAPVIPNSVTSMSQTFGGCTSLVTAPVIPNSVTNMDYTFSACTSLVNAPEIPNSVTSMSNTFSGCTSLTGTVRINSSNVTEASGATHHPFYNIAKDVTVEVPADSTTYTTMNTNKPAKLTIVTY